MLKIDVNRNNFNENVLDCQKIILLDFFASWCGPCKMLSPILEQIAKERDDIDVVKIDIDKEPELAMEYNVMSVPSLFVIKNGKIINQATGALPKNRILELL